MFSVGVRVWCFLLGLGSGLHLAIARVRARPRVRARAQVRAQARARARAAVRVQATARWYRDCTPEGPERLWRGRRMWRVICTVSVRSRGRGSSDRCCG